MLIGSFDVFGCTGVTGSLLERGRPPESCFLDSGRSPDTSALEKLLSTGFHVS